MNFEMTPRLATALSFGLRTDTLAFTRAFNQVDLRALMWLNTWVDDELLQSIQAPLRTPETLASFRQALATMTQHNGLVQAPIKKLVHRDDLAQVADFLFATSDTEVVFVYGIQRNRILLSARSRREHLHIGLALSKEFPNGQAGGHKGMAGGQLQLSSLGFEDTLPDEETHDMILNTLSQRLDILFAKEVDE
jgi:nanoRNase/pAp phosphatase (c-di-AMP/oligoRNAs hydrolase)